jgi:hypothetical protein
MTKHKPYRKYPPQKDPLEPYILAAIILLTILVIYFLLTKG